jgi:type I restriction enzyme S subunit
MHKVSNLEAHGKYKHFLLEAGDFVVSSSGTLGRLVEVFPEDLPVMLNTSTIRFKPKDSSKIDRVFLKYFLLSEAFQSQVRKLATGSVQLNYGPSHLQQVKIPVVPMRIQKTIVSIIEPIDKKIAINNLVSKNLEKIALTIFNSWFIDFEPVKAKMSGVKPVGMDDATAALFSDSMEDSELGLIPKNWTSVKLDDELLVLESGKRPRGGAAGDSGVPSIGAESIRGLGKFDFSSTKFIPTDFYDGMPSGRVNEFDVLVYKDGAGAGSYVSMFGCGFPFEKFAINEHVFLLRAKNVSQYYLYFWMAQNRVKNLMIELAQKSAQPGLNQKDMRTIGFLRPETRVVEKFSEVVAPIIMEIMKLANQSLQLSTIRDALLPRLLSGELQIPEEMSVS